MMKVLVDTSVWVAHFKQSNLQLQKLLMQDNVLCHPYIIGELACGTPPAPRKKTLGDLQLLTQGKVATLEEVMYLTEENTLNGKGCGFVDLSLLASTLLTPGTQLWTRDKRLDALALNLNIQFSG